MKFTVSWLKDHLETDADLDTILDTLTMVGLEVEEVTNPALALEQFSVAEILQAEKHPDADKLQVCKVQTGSEILQVVCGAPNARAGLKVAFAPVGATVPSNGFLLKQAKIRGVESNGMLCSAEELLLGEDSDGILELDESLAIGASLAESLKLDDPVIEIAITPNRPDCLGVYGIARDLAAAGIGTLKSGTVEPIKAVFDTPVSVTVEHSGDTPACSAFAAKLVRGVKNGPSPEWLKKRLTAIGLRPINALVDITNYISYDRARPLHVYDADKLTGGIYARFGNKGESFEGLDDKSYDVDETMCVIADEAQVLGLGGILGGTSSGSTHETQNVLIESAMFDSVSIATTGRKLSIDSDARYRFERGVDPQFMLDGLELATKMVLDICGGEAGSVVLDGTIPNPSLQLDFDTSLVSRLAGLEVSAEKIADILNDLGFACLGSGKVLNVSVPTWRPDVHGTADLVEEIVRIVGIDDLPSTPLRRASTVSKPVLTPAQIIGGRARRTLAARGMVEAVTWSFIPRVHAELFGGGADELELANPISTEMSSMRPSLLPGLLAAAKRNKDRGFADLALFEAGNIFHSVTPDSQIRVIGGLRAGTAKLSGSGRHWSGNADAVDAFDVKKDVFDVIRSAGLEPGKLQIKPEAPGWYHPGRSGVITLGPQNILAAFGEIHPKILSIFDIEGSVVGFEVFLSNLPPQKKKASRTKGALNVSDLQSVRRDFAFVVDKSITADMLLRAALGADKTLISGAQIFDVFEGASLDADKKSLGVEIILQPIEATLTDQDIDAVAEKIVAAAAKSCGAVLRG